MRHLMDCVRVVYNSYDWSWTLLKDMVALLSFCLHSGYRVYIMSFDC